MKKNAPTGTCALCGHFEILRNSHFLPAGFYRRMNMPGLITTHSVRTTSRQTRAYILCVDCEHRFDKSGEDYVLKNAANWKTGVFPLLERLRVAKPDIKTKNMLGYSGLSLNIDTEKWHILLLAIYGGLQYVNGECLYHHIIQLSSI